jgi:hypothetical protein
MRARGAPPITLRSSATDAVARHGTPGQAFAAQN